MERRNFIKIVTVSGAAVAFTGLAAGCKSDNANPAHEGWDPEKLTESFTDFRLKILSYAMLAPSPHNKQPWKIKLADDNKMLLFIDSERLLPMTDIFHRQIYISQGTFLEILSLSSNALGYDALIQFFTEGTDSVENTGKSPVAEITFSKLTVDKDVLFDYITKRVTNRLVYDERTPDASQLQTLARIFGDAECTIQFITDKNTTSQLADLMTEAMKVETYLDRTHAETVAMIRFTDEELVKFRDGFGYENMGISGMSKFLAQTFAGRDKAFSDSFKEKTVSVTRDMTHSANVFGIIFSKENNRMDQIQVGRKYARLHLTATQLGLAMHPMTQITEEYDELASIRNKFADITGPGKGTAQMVVRVGFADTVPHAPRRPLKDLITV
ncbi:hypothetical protein F9K33_02360 [bacterium]|nr:MAG: hypothetical protein F9K33_02360 [bacterium]